MTGGPCVSLPKIEAVSEKPSSAAHCTAVVTGGLCGLVRADPLLRGIGLRRGEMPNLGGYEV